MASVSPASDQTTELLQKLTLDSQNKKNHDSSEVAKKPTATQYGSANGGEVPNVVIPSYERSITPVLHEVMDPNLYGYPSPTGYYYDGYGGSINDWDGYVNHDVVEVPHGVYGDMYHHAYGYGPYSPYPSPGSNLPSYGHDGQLYSPQHYQYSTQYYQPPTGHSAPFTPNQPPTSQVESAEQPSLPVDTKANSNGTVSGNANASNGSTSLRTNNQSSSASSNSSYGRGAFSSGILPSGYQDPRFGIDGARSPVPWFDVPGPVQGRPTQTSSLSSTTPYNNLASARNQSNRSLPHLMGLHTPRPTAGLGSASPGYMNRMCPTNRMYSQYGNTFRTGLNFGSNGLNSRTSGQWGQPMNSKYNKPRGRGNGMYGCGNEILDGFSELNRGPRADPRFKNPKTVLPTVTIAVKGQTLSSIGKEDPCVATLDKEQYNHADFPENYSDAKFFIIKSYSEDDVHKSVKYSVWASTPNGNKKLDAGYQEAQEKKAGGCPVFLFFSVNGSGQFVGLAEMVGPVDFEKTVDYWQQDKWNGCFPVKWHIVKDVPNNLLKHIILENNDNKPVTNSRDTQEVKLEQGLQMIKLFKDHVSKTSILDDFPFYESRQKMVQEKRAKQQLQKQVWDGKTTEAVVDEKEKDGSNGKLRLQKPLEAVSPLNKEASQINNCEQKSPEENGVAAVCGDTSKIVNGVVSGGQI